MKPHAIGVDFSERGALVVGIDASGAVLEQLRTGAAADLPRLIAEVGWSKGVPVGVAVDAVHEAEVTKALGDSRRATPHTSNPGTAAVIAETWVGAAQGATDAICLSIGDRVFAGLWLAGKPWIGAHGRAGSAAWLALNPVERQDYRRFGSLAAEVSNSGIARRLSWRIQAGDESAVLESAGKVEAITAAHVFDAARSGDGVAMSVVRDTARYVGMAIANLAAAVDPQIVVLAGDLAAAADLVFEPIVQECSKRLPPSILPELRLELSTLGPQGVAIGAARGAAIHA